MGETCLSYLFYLLERATEQAMGFGNLINIILETDSLSGSSIFFRFNNSLVQGFVALALVSGIY